MSPHLYVRTAAVFYALRDSEGSSLVTSGTLVILGSLILAIGTLLRRSLSAREAFANPRPHTAWAQATSLRKSRAALDPTGGESKSPRHADAV